MKNSYKMLNYWKEKRPNHIAIDDGLKEITYTKLIDDTKSLVASLANMNIKAGDRVLTFLPNCYEFILLFFAVEQLGATLIPCNESCGEEEVLCYKAIVKPDIVFVSREDHHSCLSKSKSIDYEIITVGFELNKDKSFENIMGKSEYIRYKMDNFSNDKNTFIIMFTSGTTEEPKGVEHTYSNLFKAAKEIGRRMECTENDRVLSPLPLCHMFGVVTGLLLPLCFGGKTIIMEKFSPQSVLNLIEKEKVTILNGVPTMFKHELNCQRENKRDMDSLRTGLIAGDIIDNNLIHQIREELNCDILIGYGSTETVCISTTSFKDDLDKRWNTVGLPLYGVEVKVINEKGETLAFGEKGELLCKGFSIMKGYYKMPDKTLKILDNGWFHTGDLATIDAEGYIRVVGRIKDVIISGGYNIYPHDLEKFFNQHPDVIHSCVLGIPDKDMGQKVVSFIQIKENAKETEKTLKEYAMGRIAKYKIPDKIILLDSMPKLDNEKINKKVLLDYL